jgi:DNA-binding transcriptional ArsR family regulator
MEALGSALRVQMLRIIARGQPVSVNAMARALGRKPNAVGQHLRILERAGIIVATRPDGGDGRSANYLLPVTLRDQPNPDRELDLGCCVLRWPG